MHLVCGAQLTVPAAPSSPSYTIVSITDRPTRRIASGRRRTNVGHETVAGASKTDFFRSPSRSCDHGAPRPGQACEAATSRIELPPQASGSSQIVLLAIDRAGWANLRRLDHRPGAAGAIRASRSSVVGPEICERAPKLDRADRRRCERARGRSRSATARARRAAHRIRRSRLCDARTPTPCRRCCRAKLACALATYAKLPLIAATEVLYHSRARRSLQDVLTCIRHGITLCDGKPDLTRGNDEARSARGRTRSCRLYHDEPAAIARTNDWIATRCTFSTRPSCAIAIHQGVYAGRHDVGGASACKLTFARRRRSAMAARFPITSVRAQLDAEAIGRDRRARLSGLFPHDVRDRDRTAGSATLLVPGPLTRRRTPAVLLLCFGITAVDPIANGACSSSGSCHASAPSRPTSISISSTSGAKR